METTLNTRRIMRTVPDVREQRKAEILQALRHPEYLSDEQIQSLFKELAELQYSLEKNPAEVSNDNS